MKWFPALLAVCFGGGLIYLFIRFLRELRGRRTCTRWPCPECHQPFGGTYRRRRQRRDICVKDGPGMTGPILHCSHCKKDFWFTWTGKHPSYPNDAYEIAPDHRDWVTDAHQAMDLRPQLHHSPPNPTAQSIPIPRPELFHYARVTSRTIATIIPKQPASAATILIIPPRTLGANAIITPIPPATIASTAKSNPNQPPLTKLSTAHITAAIEKTLKLARWTLC